MKRILVALDASGRAPLVLTAAARLAELTGAKLVLFRAIYAPTDIPRTVYSLHGVELEDFLVKDANDQLRKLAATVDASRVEAIVAELATPWDGICRAAHSRDADLIVIGSHGFGGIDRVLGTTAAKVVNHTDRNVLVVRTAVA